MHANVHAAAYTVLCHIVSHEAGVDINMEVQIFRIPLADIQENIN